MLSDSSAIGQEGIVFMLKSFVFLLITFRN